MPHIGMPELIVILALMLLVFGPKKLPEIARGLGQGIKEFKQAMHDAFASEAGARSAGPVPGPAPARPSAAPDRGEHQTPEASVPDKGPSGG